MFDWIYSNREVFLSNYVEIGRNHTAAKKLQEEHNQFTIASNVSMTQTRSHINTRVQLIVTIYNVSACLANLEILPIDSR